MDEEELFLDLYFANDIQEATTQCGLLPPFPEELDLLIESLRC